MSLYLPVSFLLLQLGLLLFVPSIIGPAAYLFMVAAPLLTAGAALWRARSESAAARAGWSAVAVALMVWSAALSAIFGRN